MEEDGQLRRLDLAGWIRTALLSCAAQLRLAVTGRKSQTDGSPAGIIVESMHWTVLHRPVEPARVTDKCYLRDPSVGSAGVVG